MQAFFPLIVIAVLFVFLYFYDQNAESYIRTGWNQFAENAELGKLEQVRIHQNK